MHVKKLNTYGFVHLGVVALIILVLITVFYVYRAINNKQVANTTESVNSQSLRNNVSGGESFTFSAAGDFGSNSNASAVLSKIGETKPAFTLALGDLGYVGNGNEKAWCDFVHQRVGSNHPFEVVAGNHDDGTSEGSIFEYRKCLPNKIENLVGDYGIEYYFDYNNLARFVLISPDIDDLGYIYEKSSPHYKWLEDTINDARKKQIPWVILGMHKNCITAGVKTCEIGQDLLNLIVKKNVDLVLQGHEHAYSRSKQLKFAPGCSAIIINEFNQNCVTASGNTLIKGGSTIVISGAGGYDLRDINTKDREIEYFDTWNGKSEGKSYGFSLFTIDNNKLIGEFVPAVGDYTDKFEINR